MLKKHSFKADTDKLSVLFVLDGQVYGNSFDKDGFDFDLVMASMAHQIEELLSTPNTL